MKKVAIVTLNKAHKGIVYFTLTLKYGKAAKPTRQNWVEE